MILETEAAVMANFEFLTQADVEMDEDDDICDELDMDEQDELRATTKRKASHQVYLMKTVNNILNCTLYSRKF